MVKKSKKKGSKSKRRKEIQDRLNEFGASNVVLTLMCDPSIPEEIF